MEKNLDLLCMACFSELQAAGGACPVCGFDEKLAYTSGQLSLPHHLQIRTILNGKYLVGKVLGEGGFGITYIGYDLNLDIKVAIKEYFPSGFATRTATVSETVQPHAGDRDNIYITGRERFVNEAKRLAKFRVLPGVVMVNDFFAENATAYIVMEYVDGETLKTYLGHVGGTLPLEQVLEMLKPMFGSLAQVHQEGIIHRDISPDNIMITPEGNVKLLDFGAAREFGEDNKSLSVMLKHGYAPMEQYTTKGIQGPWTDVYAVCATIYKAITSITPEGSMDRVLSDSVKPPSYLGVEIEPYREAALMRGLAVKVEDRFQTMSDLYGALYEGKQPAVEAVVNRPLPEPPQQQSYTQPVYQEQSYQPQYQQPNAGVPFAAPADTSQQQYQPQPQKADIKKYIPAIICAAVVLCIMIGIAIANPFSNDIQQDEDQMMADIQPISASATPEPIQTPTPTPPPTEPPTEPPPTISPRPETLHDAIYNMDYWVRITLDRSDIGRGTTIFERDIGSNVWVMTGISGSFRIVNPTFGQSGNSVSIGFPTTNSKYSLYDGRSSTYGDGTGVSNDSLKWYIETGNDYAIARGQGEYLTDDLQSALSNYDVIAITMYFNNGDFAILYRDQFYDWRIRPRSVGLNDINPSISYDGDTVTFTFNSNSKNYYYVFYDGGQGEGDGESTSWSYSYFLR